jgi:hypothetical protein
MHINLILDRTLIKERVENCQYFYGQSGLIRREDVFKFSLLNKKAYKFYTFSAICKDMLQ